MINPGAAPIPDASEAHAAANIQAFAAAVREHPDSLVVADPVRDSSADDSGRYGWVLAAGDKTVTMLMPGVEGERLRDMSTSAPCLRVGAEWWWWPSAVVQAVGALR